MVSSPLRGMWRSMSGQGRELAGAAVIGSIASLCSVALLGTAAWLITTAAGMPPVLTLTVAAVSVRFFALGRAVFRYAERLIGHDGAFRGLSTLRVGVYLNLERLAPAGLGRFTRGDLLSRLIADVDAAMDLPLRVILPWVQAGIVLAACVAGLAWILPAIAWWIALIGLLALLGAPWLAGALARHAERQVAPERAELAGLVVTTLDGVADLLAFDAAARALAEVEAADRRATQLLQRASLALGIGGGQGILLQGLAVSGALWIAIPQVSAGRMAAPWLAVVVLLPLALLEVLGTLPAAALALQRLRGSADRLAELDGAPDPAPSAGVLGGGRVQVDEQPGQIEVEQLTASWIPGGPAALNEVTFSVPAGAHLSIVGPSGSGKSTLAAVLAGFLDYQGSVRIEGKEVRECDPDLLRRGVGILAQRSHVFDTTIEENIRLGRPAEAGEVWRALAQAQFDEAVRRMPLGLGTRVGPFGNALSGGEAQRLALARLMLQPPRILLLDEPTEHLDAQTAAGIEDTLRALGDGRTQVVITHRVSAIPARNAVIVLHQGRITASGRAEHLARGDGWFARQRQREEAELDLVAMIEQLPVGFGVPAGRPGRT